MKKYGLILLALNAYHIQAMNFEKYKELGYLERKLEERHPIKALLGAWGAWYTTSLTHISSEYFFKCAAAHETKFTDFSQKPLSALITPQQTQSYLRGLGWRTAARGTITLGGSMSLFFLLGTQFQLSKNKEETPLMKIFDAFDNKNK